MYAICQIKTILNSDGKNDYFPDVAGSGYTNCVMSPTLTDQLGNRKAKNWCILWLTDQSNATGNIFRITEDIANTFWGDLPNGRKNQYINFLDSQGINHAWLNDSLTILQVIENLIAELKQ